MQRLDVSEELSPTGRSWTRLAFQKLTFLSLFSVVLAAPLSQQLQPKYISLRSLFDARERPSKLYSWVTLVFSSVLVEIPWNVLAGEFIHRLTIRRSFSLSLGAALRAIFPC